jgi:apolipoprotein D and lipocalin family protein
MAGLRSAQSMAHAEDMRLALGLLAALTVCLPLAAQTSRQPLRVVESVDLTRYAGRWYEAARLPNRFQDQCAGDVVVHYALRADGRIEVVNRCRTSDGKVDEAHGIGRKAGDQQSSARLEVRFAPAILSFLSSVWGDYWIIGLGPEYTWAVVGTPSREYLWILSRTPEMSATSYERALEIARGNGFDVTRVVKTTNSGKAQ